MSDNNAIFWQSSKVGTQFSIIGFAKITSNIKKEDTIAIMLMLASSILMLAIDKYEAVCIPENVAVPAMNNCIAVSVKVIFKNANDIQKFDNELDKLLGKKW